MKIFDIAVLGAWRPHCIPGSRCCGGRYEELTFVGVRTDMTAVELSPGGGWFMEKKALHPLLLRQSKGLVAEQAEHRAQSFVADDCALVGMLELIELSVIATFALVLDFDPPVRPPETATTSALVATIGTGILFMPTPHKNG